jgi:hypothetical protein
MHNFIRTFLICLAMSLLLLLACPTVNADVLQPTGRDTTMSASFDKSSPPSQVSIWKDESGGYDTSRPSLWGRNYWACLSSTDPQYGKCKTSGSWGGGGETSIPLTFKEKRSGVTTTINVTGFHHFGAYGPYQTYAAVYFDGIAETTATFYISQTELSKFPVGGIWEAELKVNLMQWDPNIVLGNWNAHITLDVLDSGNQQIYLPEFGTAAPHVDLNLRPLPGTSGNQTMLSGTASLDMCLYDGYNANSSTFTLTAQDQMSEIADRESGMFSVYTKGNSSKNMRIDYRLDVLDPATKTYNTMNNMQNYVIRDIQKAPLRSVHLPGIPQSVVCVPSRLRFTTPEFAIASKQAGQYTARLRLFLTSQM